MAQAKDVVAQCIMWRCPCRDIVCLANFVCFGGCHARKFRKCLAHTRGMLLVEKSAVENTLNRPRGIGPNVFCLCEGARSFENTLNGPPLLKAKRSVCVKVHAVNRHLHLSITSTKEAYNPLPVFKFCTCFVSTAQCEDTCAVHLFIPYLFCFFQSY